MQDQIVTVIKKTVEENIRETVEEEINKEVENFRQKLEDKKEQYIAEIMNGIAIYHQQNIGSMSMDYKIIFENRWRIDK